MILADIRLSRLRVLEADACICCADFVHLLRLTVVCCKDRPKNRLVAMGALGACNFSGAINQISQKFHAENIIFQWWIWIVCIVFIKIFIF